jgi:protein-disulfide isomerase
MNAPSGADLKVGVSPADHRIGRLDAPVTLVEYGDFQCPICKLAFPAVKLLLRRHAGEICFVYRHFPLETLHPLALMAAEAAECAASQGQFWEMHDVLFENQPRLQRTQLDEYAGRLKLDRSRFAAELDTHAHAGTIRGHIESGVMSNVHGTPGFFVNGRIVDASYGMRSIFDAVDTALRSPERAEPL